MSENPQNPEYRPRLSIDISEDLHKRYQDLVPWGLRSQLIIVLLEDVLNMIETYGDIVTALIIKRKLHAKDVLKGEVPKDVSN